MIERFLVGPGGEGGALGYFLGGYVRPGLQIGTPLKETDLGVVQAFFDPQIKRDHVKTQTYEKTWII